MSVQQFWAAIARVNASPFDPDAYRRALVAVLADLGPHELARFHQHTWLARSQLRQRSIWCAASLLLGRPCADHEFTDLRAWIIAHGQAAHERICVDADALAQLPLHRDDHGQPRVFLAPLNATPGKLYRKLVANDDDLDAAIRAELAADPVAAAALEPDDHLGWAYWELPSADELARTLPRLWAAHGSRWTPVDHPEQSPFASFVRAADVPGLGRVVIGDTLITRHDGQALQVLGLCDSAVMAADLGVSAELLAAEARYVARVRDSSGEIHANQALAHRYLRWPHELDNAPPTDIGDDTPSGAALSDAELDAWEARDEQIQAQVAAAIGPLTEVQLIYAAYEEGDDGLPINNLHETAYRGRIRFVETDSRDGECYESAELRNPTWLDLACAANAALVALGYEDQIYLEGFEVIHKPRGQAAVAAFCFGS
jgi:hypothetical protein